jgi:hypothetical protein
LIKIVDSVIEHIKERPEWLVPSLIEVNDKFYEINESEVKKLGYKTIVKNIKQYVKPMKNKGVDE